VYTATAFDLEHAYRRDHARLVGLAAWLVDGRGLAEEVVHDVFVRVVENPPTLRDSEQLGSYLRAAVVNHCRSRVRRLVLERRHLKGERDSTDPLPDDALSEDSEHVRAAVLALPMRQRQAIVLRFYDDLTVDQIAEALGVSSGSVKTHLHRAKQMLASVLDTERLAERSEV
jgi:RNA polymerase sigma factor (sigma-70 family)